MLQFLAELLVSLLILAGSFFLLVGSIGLAKLPSLIQRLHAPDQGRDPGRRRPAAGLDALLLGCSAATRPTMSC